MPERHINTSADQNTPIISIENLSHRYPGARTNALNEVTLEVPHGGVTGLLGPNGAGKSTLLAILTGIIRPRAGQVRVDGVDPRHGHHLRTISALVPQDYAFYPTLSGRENLAFFAGIHGLTGARWREQLAWCVEVCRLETVLERRAHEYSGGLKRRLNLAIGLLNDPRILYLDEPTVGIDTESRRTILQAITTLRERGITMIYTSHYMEEVEAVCDHVAVIDGGRIVAADTLPALLSRMGNTALRLSLDQAPGEAVRDALAAWEPRWISEQEVLLPAVTQTDAARLLSLLDEHGLTVQQMRYGVSRLEEVYLRLLAGGRAA